MALKSKPPTPEDIDSMEMLKKAMQNICAKYPETSATSLLAMASQLVGNLIALQDQTAHTREEMWELVTKNIEVGNQAAIETFMANNG